jgi:hypothetical protein
LFSSSLRQMTAVRHSLSTIPGARGNRVGLALGCHNAAAFPASAPRFEVPSEGYAGWRWGESAVQSGDWQTLRPAKDLEVRHFEMYGAKVFDLPT